MTHKRTIQSYIYERDNRKCFYCEKPLKPGKMTLDHYFPRSLGGTEEYYNLVACCKLCNKYKKSRVPSDWVERNVLLLVKAIEDDKITMHHEHLKDRSHIYEMAKQTVTIEHTHTATIFEGRGFRLFLKDNKIIKVVYFATQA